MTREIQTTDPIRSPCPAFGIDFSVLGDLDGREFDPVGEEDLSDLVDDGRIGCTGVDDDMDRGDGRLFGELPDV